MDTRYEIKPYKNHRETAAISFYILDDSGAKQMEKLSCIWCKRTIMDIKGRIDLAITTPMPVEDFGVAINIGCKLCGQRYRLLINPTVAQ